MDLKTYCHENRGAQTRIAQRLGVPTQLVWQWQSGYRQVPDNRCPAIERVTEGVVTCEKLRPDVAWRRIADSDWPWHSAGRPLIDPTAIPAQEVRHAA